MRELTILYDPNDKELLSCTLTELIRNGCDSDKYDSYEEKMGAMLDAKTENKTWNNRCGKKVVAITRQNDYCIHGFCAEHWKKFRKR